MTLRLSRSGELYSDPALGVHIGFASPCSGCRAAFCSRAATLQIMNTAAEPLNPALQRTFSGRIGQPVEVSVSRRGLTLVCLLLFGPVLLVLAAMAVVSALGTNDDLSTVVGLSALPLALLLGRHFARSWGDRLIDLNLKA